MAYTCSILLSTSPWKHSLNSSPVICHILNLSTIDKQQHRPRWWSFCSCIKQLGSTTNKYFQSLLKSSSPPLSTKTQPAVLPRPLPVAGSLAPPTLTFRFDIWCLALMELYWVFALDVSCNHFSKRSFVKYFNFFKIWNEKKQWAIQYMLLDERLYNILRHT